MTERAIYDLLVWAWLGVAVLTVLSLLWITAPYGRHARGGWGPQVSNRVGWVLMEAPASLAFLGFWLYGGAPLGATALAFLGLWQLHYVYRAFIYPFAVRGDPARGMPLSIALMGALFNVVNAYLNARWLFGLGPSLPASWLADPRFLAGAALFLGGLATNRWADRVLRELRQPGEHGYKVPRGGLYERISCPNYFGETVQWIGWAVLTWSPGGAVFALWTAANLVPRAVSHHRWYQSKFADYPPERRAVIPYVL